MNNVVIRSLVLLAVSTAIVLVSAFVAPPASPEQDGTEGHAAHDMRMAVDSEEAFITGMIPHHQEAVGSARAVLETTQRPEVRELAQSVIATQTDEIATLEGWLAEWYPDAAEADYTPMMRDPAGLSPDEADRAFLEGMIVHHQGAIDMARSYLNADFDKRPVVAALAEDIIAAQDSESEQMQGWLEAWDGAEHDAH